MITLTEKESSLICGIDYNEEQQKLTLHFRKYYVDQLSYYEFDKDYYDELLKAKSKGRFYLHMIKPNFPTFNSQKMAADKIIKMKIDLKKLKSDWLFVSKDTGAVYANITLMYKETPDQYGNCGMIVQDVPTDLYKQEKEQNVPAAQRTQGPILGNGKEFAKQGAPPTQSMSSLSDKEREAAMDDLPF